jgi:hypothetical protein
MSLLISITHHTFVIMIEDSDPLEIYKVTRLTDSVLLGIVGDRPLAEKLKEELHKQTDHGTDLKLCGQQLEQTVSAMKKSQLLDESHQLEVVLAGFYRNGRAGQVTYEMGNTDQQANGKVTELIYPLKNAHNEYFYVLIPPDRALLPASELLLELPDDDETTLQNYSTHLLTYVHPVISRLYPDLVKPRGRALILSYNGEYSSNGHRREMTAEQKLTFSELDYDTATLIEDLPPKEDLLDMINLKS